MASPVPLSAATLAIRRLRTMTLRTLLIFRPQPVSPEEAPTPSSVLSEATVTSAPAQSRVPLSLITSGMPRAASVCSAGRLATVTVRPPAPPVVPPLSPANPSAVEAGVGADVPGVDDGADVGMLVGAEVAAVGGGE